MIAILLNVLKYWKQGGLVLIALVFAMSLYLAHHRGVKLERLESDYKDLQQIHQTQIKSFEKAFKDEKNRYEFKVSQDRKLRSADWRAAYDSLRQRQSDRASR